MTEPALADACAIIVFFGDEPGRITPALRRAMLRRPRVSPVTVWEISHQIAAGRLPPLARGMTVARKLEEAGLTPHPLTWADAERANALPPLHKDPMDRMLIAQALNAGLPVITRDRLFAGYGVATIW